MLNKFLFVVMAVIVSVFMADAKTLRVNNVSGSGAQYSSFDEAYAAASEGDIIIFDGSYTSYGDIVVEKKLTIQGPGYFLGVNNTTNEGIECAEFGKIELRADGSKVTGIVANSIYLKANDLVVTRCYVSIISVCEQFSYTDQSISNGIIHQNYITGRIDGDSYSAPANYMQISNNIMKGFYGLGNLNKSTISRNTIIFNYDISYRQLTDCIFEYNIGPIPGDYWANENNTVLNHIESDREIYKDTKNDKEVKEVDSSLMSKKGVFTHGAFSGDDPYVLSGLLSGPRIQDIEMPESVMQGDNMKVSVKIAVTQ